MCNCVGDAALEGAEHVDDGTDERGADLQLSEPKGDCEFKDVAGREPPTAPTPFCVLNVRTHDAFLAKVDEAMLRPAEHAGCLGERPFVGPLSHPERDRLS